MKQNSQLDEFMGRVMSKPLSNPEQEHIDQSWADVALAEVNHARMRAGQAPHFDNKDRADAAIGTNPKDRVGITKAPVSLVPPVAILQQARALAVGANKYGRANWRDHPVQRVVYLEAAMRHILADLDGETIDPETGVPHIAHAAAGLDVLMDAEANGMVVDNRPKKGAYAVKASEFYPPKDQRNE